MARRLLVLERCRGALLIMLFSSSAVAAEPLLVTFIDKPPYYYADASGEPRGFLIERTRQILGEAKIEARFNARPASRVPHEMRTESLISCSIGWFRNAERETFARFSRPIYHDRPLLGVVQRARAAEFPSPYSVAALAASGARIGSVAGFSHGDAVDRVLASMATPVDLAPAPAQNLSKLLAGRIDLALFNSEELDYFIAETPGVSGRLSRIEFSDVPPGRARHLMCSRHIDPGLLERIDAAISRLRFDQR